MDDRISPLTLPIHIDYRVPARVRRYVTLACAGAVVCIWLSGLPASVRLPLSAGVLLFLYAQHRSWRHTARRCPGARLLLDSDDKWRVVDAGGAEYTARLEPGGIAHAALIVLRFRLPGVGRRVFILTRDNLDPVTARRLRVRLRFPVQNVSGGQAPADDY